MIYILGAGALARETLSAYKDLGRLKEVAGFIEENCRREGSEIHGRSIMDASIINTLPKDTLFIGAMGSPKRKRWVEEIEGKGFNFDTIIHPSTLLDDFVDIDKGCIIRPGVSLACDVKIGRHSIIYTGSTIGHDCKIGNFVTIAPGVDIGGNVAIKDGCWIGIGAKIINRVSIGRGSFIGAGAVVTKDIPENVLALGIPAKPIRQLNVSDWERMI